MTYQIIESQSRGKVVKNIKFIGSGESVSFIPFGPANTDYQRFKIDIANGAELQDADGQVMTAEQVQEFLETLP